MKHVFNRSIYVYICFLLLIVLLVGTVSYVRNRQKPHMKCQLESKAMKKLYEKHGISYNIIDGRTVLTKKSENKSLVLCKLNSTNSKKLSSSKIETQKRLSHANIPVSKFVVWDNSKSTRDNILKIHSKLQFPLVVKYSNGSMGTSVYTNIYNDRLMERVIKKLKNENKHDIIIEEQQLGDRYRIYIFNNEIIFIQRFSSPVIIGNGRSTVSQLIRDYPKNAYNPTKYKLNPISHIEEHLIQKQGYEMDSILESNTKINVTGIVTYSNGAIMENIPISTVPQSNIDMFLHINQISGLTVNGIDFISEDIRVPYSGKVLETNPFPSYDPDHQTPEINKHLLEAMFR